MCSLADQKTFKKLWISCWGNCHILCKSDPYSFYNVNVRLAKKKCSFSDVSIDPKSEGCWIGVELWRYTQVRVC